jgi:GNAT superfamily N-acetyltransferase
MISVAPVDPRDVPAFDEWFAVLRQTDQERWPGKPGWQRAERLALALDEEGPEEHRSLAARDAGGRVVGIADLEMFRRENLHLARLDVRVLPAHRRRGAGTALVAAAADMAARTGRRELGGLDESPDREGYVDAAAPFARHLGFAPVQRMVRRELELPIPAERLDALRRHPRAAPPGYAMVTFADRWPDEHLQDRCVMGRAMSTDAPVGEQELDEEVWDGARVRQIEAALAAQNRAKVTTAARHEASGHLVAFTEVVVPLGAPEAAWQHDTLVTREHRGHGSGFAMKVANAAAVMDAHPAVRTVGTMNASDNTHMIAVNDEIGCVVVSSCRYWLKKFDPS